jgi:UDP-N-acetylmuramoyl-tripeptide--D-alanyl-D-alanine ligase
MIQKIYNAFLECHQKITTDTRNISEGCLFFALKGPNFNGNKFAKEAIQKGAKYVIIDEKEYHINTKTFLVSNVLETLQALALFHRKKFKIPVVGITGTNGKTTTKELIGAVLSSKFNILITKGNLNNHIGVPLTLLQLNENHQIAVIEMGASKKGDIKELADISIPTHGLITNIGKAHLEGFGDIETIRKTKLELYNNIIENNGEIIVNQEDQFLLSKIPKDIKTHYYGSNNKGNIYGEVVSFNPTIEVKITFEKENIFKVSTYLLGAYNLLNILAAAVVGKIFNLESEKITSSIENYIPSNNRSQLINSVHNTIIVDCYNANPTSTLESLISLNLMKGDHKIAILGDMLELGEQSDIEHQLIVDFLVEKKIDCLLVGSCYNSTKSNFNKFENTDLLIEYLKKENLKEHLFLLKASRGIQLEKIIKENIL